MAEVILSMSAGRTGATVVLDGEEILGIITDGDLRRGLERGDIAQAQAREWMSSNPRILDAGDLAVRGFQLMKASSISQVIVRDGKRYAGLVHLHDLMREGIF